MEPEPAPSLKPLQEQGRVLESRQQGCRIWAIEHVLAELGGEARQNRDRVADAGLDVGRAHLDRAEAWAQPDIPTLLALVGKGPAAARGETSSNIRRNWLSSPLGLGMAEDATRLPVPLSRRRLLMIDDAPLTVVEWAKPISCTSSASCVIESPLSSIRGS
jgi:hypothetical protein